MTLIQNVADVNEQDDSARAPLNLAVLKECNDSALLLLQNGAEINLRDIDRETPMGLALKSEYRGTEETASFLMSRGGTE